MIFLFVIKLLTICIDILWFCDVNINPSMTLLDTFFCNQIISVWNLLPESVVSSTTLKVICHQICHFANFGFFQEFIYTQIKKIS